MASSKGKERRDWQIKLQDELAHPADLAKLKFPFKCSPELKDSVPAEYTENLEHLQGMQKGAPWTGYYGNYRGAKIAIAMAYGMWYEIKFGTGQQFRAVRVAQQALHVKHCPMEGIDMDVLHKLSPIYVESHAPTPFQTPTLPPQQPNKPESEPEWDDNMAPKTHSADTAKGWRRPPPH